MSFSLSSSGSLFDLKLLSTQTRIVEGKYRTLSIKDLETGNFYGYILDIDARSFEDSAVAEVIGKAKTTFVNAVMGFTPHFTDGSQALDNAIDRNTEATKMYGGGDTLQEFKNLCPGLYLSVMDNAKYYFFHRRRDCPYSHRTRQPVRT